MLPGFLGKIDERINEFKEMVGEIGECMKVLNEFINAHEPRDDLESYHHECTNKLRHIIGKYDNYKVDTYRFLHVLVNDNKILHHEKNLEEAEHEKTKFLLMIEKIKREDGEK
ncbi:MAG: hypothetical protein RBT65_02385 [Methanolobus sp.]|nr:hypothetical protein [Methanolobus sp.]